MNSRPRTLALESEGGGRVWSANDSTLALHTIEIKRRSDMDEVTQLKARIADLEAELLRLKAPTPIKKTFDTINNGHLILVWSAT